jgi:hypothetical protein
VLTVILVLLIASGAALLAVSSRFNITALEHQEQQAYYTALSTLDTVSHWIASGYEPDATHHDAVENVLEDADGSGGVDYPLDLDSTLGECTLHLEYIDTGDTATTSLELTATATFAGSVKTLSMTMQRGADPSTYDGELEADDFSTEPYDTRAAGLNAFQSGGIIALYESSASNYNMYFNKPDTAVTSGNEYTNKEMLKNYINVAENRGLTLEARWTNLDLLKTGSGDSSHPYILGTERLPGGEAKNGYTYDWRRFIVPENGRITIDPLEADTATGGDDKTDEDGDANTRIVGLAIHDTDGKDVQFRLASGSAAVGTTAGNVFVSTASSTSNGTTITRTLTANKVFNNRSEPRWNSLITLNFTDNYGSAENDETAHYTINGEVRSYPWHPNSWNKMDLFVQSGGKLDTTNLVLGPFLHKYSSANDKLYTRFDYEGKGIFIDSYNGKTGKNVASEWGYVNAFGTGLPVFSVDFGKNAGFWILDGGGSEDSGGSKAKYFRIMQGVNILGGTDSEGHPDPDEKSIIYSTRKTIIGGALIRGKSSSTTNSSNNYTTDNLNAFLPGFADQTVTSNINYVEATTRFSQLIYNTDIILKAPLSGTAESTIRRPDTWRDRRNMPRSTGTDAQTLPYRTDTSYDPTMTIAGGTIYVGSGQHLTIEGTVTGATSGTNAASKALDNMWISPDKIVVAAGGALTIQKSETINVLTDIYVEGGTLNIDKEAKIKGNIYAYNGGKVNIKGDFKLFSPHDDGNDNVLTEAEAKDGILIYADQLVGKVDGITSPGILILPKVGPGNVQITGSSNKVHILGTVDGTTVKKPDLTEFDAANLKAIKEALKLLCDGRDPTTGTCTHFGFLDGEWIGGVFMHG